MNEEHRVRIPADARSQAEWYVGETDYCSQLASIRIPDLSNSGTTLNPLRQQTQQFILIQQVVF